MRLTDCFIELFGYAAYFQKTVSHRQPPYEKVKADILRFITQSEECLKKNIFSQDDFNLARFAVYAWVDEIILNSQWKEKDKWQREQLQRLYYNTTDAGEEFFERLNALGIHQREIREVYYLCLAMGFKGRYSNEKDKYLLEQVKTSNLKVLIGSSVGLPAIERIDLFPEAYPGESTEIAPKRKRGFFSPITIFCLVSPVVLFVFLYIIYSFILTDIGKQFLSMVT